MRGIIWGDVKRLIRFAFWYWVGYSATTQAMPYLQAKLEAMDIDEMWDMLNAEEMDG